MIIDFAVTNFRSIKDKQVFSMEPEKKVKEIESNVCTAEKLKLLKTSIIYGRNASGKSNLLKAVRALNFLVRNSSEYIFNQQIPPYEPFRLDTKFSTSPVELEINFIAKDGLKYNYFISFNEKAILKEKLYGSIVGKKPFRLFERDFNKKIIPGKNLENNYLNIEKSLYPNQLFLSKVGKEKIDSLIPAYTFLTRHLFVHTFHESEFDNMAIQELSRKINDEKDELFTSNIIKLINASDTGIHDIIIKESDKNKFEFPSDFDKDEREKIINRYKYKIGATHALFKEGKHIDNITFDINQESTGTKKLLALGFLIFEALEDGDVLVIDELDKSLHPLLTKILIKLFSSSNSNPRNAQLIFASHDVSLLNNSIFRRDQIWFSEKDQNGTSTYYSLSNLKGVRKDITYEKYYLNGAFGGIPVINEYEFDFKFSNEK